MNSCATVFPETATGAAAAAATGAAAAAMVGLGAAAGDATAGADATAAPAGKLLIDCFMFFILEYRVSRSAYNSTPPGRLLIDPFVTFILRYRVSRAACAASSSTSSSFSVRGLLLVAGAAPPWVG